MAGYKTIFIKCQFQYGRSRTVFRPLRVRVLINRILINDFFVVVGIKSEVEPFRSGQLDDVRVHIKPRGEIFRLGVFDRPEAQSFIWINE